MTKFLFEEWVTDLNKIFEKQSRKIVLLLDNCSSHFKVELSNIKMFFLPPNITSIHQPLDLGIIKNLKDFYKFFFKFNFKIFKRNLLMNRFVEGNFEKVDLLDAIMLTKIAWNSVKNLPFQNVLQVLLSLMSGRMKQHFR